MVTRRLSWSQFQDNFFLRNPYPLFIDEKLATKIEEIVLSGFVPACGVGIISCKYSKMSMVYSQLLVKVVFIDSAENCTIIFLDKESASVK